MRFSLLALAASAAVVSADNLSDAVNALSQIANTDTAAYNSWLQGIVGQLSGTATDASGANAALFSFPTLDSSMSAALESLTAALAKTTSGSDSESKSGDSKSKSGSSSTKSGSSSAASSSSSSSSLAGVGKTGPVLAGGALLAVISGLLM